MPKKAFILMSLCKNSKVEMEKKSKAKVKAIENKYHENEVDRCILWCLIIVNS
jgi:hypothetical protein